MFPILEAEMGLTYTQIGIIAFALNMTASVIQPVVGVYTDKKPSPFALPIGLCFTFIGVVLAVRTTCPTPVVSWCFWFNCISDR